MTGVKSYLKGAAILTGLMALAACEPVNVEQDKPDTTPANSEAQASAEAAAKAAPRLTQQEAARSFVQVVRKMEPKVERECLERRSKPINCDFQFVVDDSPNAGINAFQTVDGSGRPIIGFTLPLIAEARNADELAFVVGHEASHHILDHLDRKTGAATAGAVILGGIAAVYGADVTAVETAQRVGATVGSRYYSKDWELQADYLGSIITANAGYDPKKGAQFFLRIPDPGNRILGTHPARADRLAQVDRALSDLSSGRAR